MFERLVIRLALYNVTVFSIVLIFFSLIIYITVTEGMYRDLRADMTRLVDSVVASIDFDEDDEMKPESAAPDLIDSILPDSASDSLSEMNLQWFDKNGKLSIERGRFKTAIPLANAGGFQLQEHPRAMILTKPVMHQNQLLGYARVSRPLAHLDSVFHYLQLGLCVGVLVAILISGIGIIFLIRQSLRPLTQNLHQLRQFTADASHELRTPVTAIVSNSEVALKYSEGMRESDREKFTFILTASRQMGRLVDDLLRLDVFSNKLNANFTVQELAPILEQVRELVLWLALSNEIKLTWNVENDLFVVGSPDELQHVFRNLLENAYRYSLKGGEVTLSASNRKDYVVVVIIDKGIGIDAAELPNIFDRFWREDKARTHHESGNGLGLAIVMSTLKNLNGTIEVESVKGRGTTFTVKLPKPKLRLS
ncbi:MAG: hypothetical protein IAF58_06145 [Leptolyngbya sp.]|nr:hypothetical protein [Candidatus Melainabacteria bacterium]